MENKKCLILLSIVIISCIIFIVGFNLANSGFDKEIGIDRFDTEVTNYTVTNNTGTLWETYLYSVYLNLENVSSWYDGGEVIVYFYNDSGIVLSDEVPKSNNTTIKIDNNTYDEHFKTFVGFAFLHSDKLINITHVTILLLKSDGTVVFNETRSFDMNNYKNDTSNLDDLSNTTSNESNTSSSDDEMYYVASADSDIYHEWYCSRASKISDANKIIFQTREEAENQGFTPCKVCCP